MMSMLHMKLVWRVELSENGCDIKTDVGSGGPLFYICRVERWLCNDDTGCETAAMIAKSHNEELRRELLQAYKGRWQSELPENASFYVTRKGMTLAKLDAGYKLNGEIYISSGELLAHDRIGGEKSPTIFITLGGLRGVLLHASIPHLLDDGVLANY